MRTTPSADESTLHSFVDLGDVQLHIERPRTSQAPGRPTLLLLPQWPFGAWHHRPSLAPLARFADPVAVDLPGFGWSPAPPSPLDVAGHSSVIVRLIAELALPEVVILARAASTPIAVETALRVDLKGLILHGPFTHSPAERARKRDRAWTAPEPDASGDHLAAAWGRVTGRYPDLPVALTTACAIAHLTAAASQSEAYRAMWSYDTVAALERVRTPTVAFVGRDEPLAAHLGNAPASVRRLSDPIIPSETDHLAWTDPSLYVEIVGAALRLLEVEGIL
jgi:pimeloyl-ACP methyl ester carboxylesterase